MFDASNISEIFRLVQINTILVQQQAKTAKNNYQEAF